MGFAVAALDAVAGLAMLQREVMIVHRLAGKAAGGAGNIVEQGKILFRAIFQLRLKASM